MLTFYFSPGSSSMAPHIALHEVGAPFEPKLTSLHQQKNRAPDYLALNPEGKVPTLMVDAKPLTEVAAILWYLGRRYPEAGLLPAGDIDTESRIISWMSFIASTVHPARRAGLERWRAAFVIAEEKLGGQDWAIDRYSIADIHLFRLYWRFVDAEGPHEADYPGLTAHYERMMARPAVQRTLEIESAIGYNLP
ncbi:MAG TPA: glutathione S-transferase family protein [Stellaceae bacterium]|jgi:glutathione S-transferase|nr:glutathione S-transferase family protein [Stellaceae bacterium]